MKSGSGSGSGEKLRLTPNPMEADWSSLLVMEILTRVLSGKSIAAAASLEKTARSPEISRPEYTIKLSFFPFSRFVISTTVFTGKESVAIYRPVSVKPSASIAAVPSHTEALSSRKIEKATQRKIVFFISYQSLIIGIISLPAFWAN